VSTGTSALGQLRVSTFAGAASLPVHVARDRGYFGACGLEVELVETTSSNELMTGLVTREFSIVHAAPDNVVAWHDREATDIVAWIGLASGPVALAVVPEMASVADLRGHRIAVDAPQSGFVSILRRMLREAEVEADEVVLVPVGATGLRLEALRSGGAAATLLTFPWLLSALDEGFVVLAEQSKVVPRLQGSCGASLREWLTTHSAMADAYLRGLISALTWLYLPASREPVRRLVRERFGLDERQAGVVCDAFLDPATGWPPSAMIDSAGMELVCALREDSDAPARESPQNYYTLDPYARVMGSSLLGVAL